MNVNTKAEAEAEPLGVATWPGGAIVAELLGVDRWRVTVAGQDDPEMAQALTSRYRGEYTGPADGYYGQGILRDLAEKTGGTYTFRQPPPLAPGDAS